MKLRLAFLFATLLTVCSIVKAQTFEVPLNYVLKDKSDYPKYQADVLKAVDWLVQTPWSEQGVKRKDVNAFLIAWISGSPTVNIEINDFVTKLADKNGELLIMYMAGYTKYELENPGDKDKQKPRVAGVKMVLAKYQNDKDFKKDKGLEKLIVADKEGTLDTTIAQAFL